MQALSAASIEEPVSLPELMFRYLRALGRQSIPLLPRLRSKDESNKSAAGRVVKLKLFLPASGVRQIFSVVSLPNKK